MTPAMPDQIQHLTNTGRVKGLIHPVAQDILYTQDFDAMCLNELRPMSQVDLAHLLMLRRTEILSHTITDPLIDVILELQSTEFAPLRGRTAPRGTYMLYESFLIEKLGIDLGGYLQTARSRNDLSATMQRMRQRIALANLVDDLIELQNTLLRQAEKYLATPFPVFTHYQAAQPTTLAQYFLAVVTALQRSHNSLEDQFRQLAICPLGAGAITGTSFPIETDTTAAYLGFDHGPTNAIDMVASRDHALRSVQECAILGVTISRLGHDLQLWTTQDFNLLEVDDNLVGISSMMPQKRNVYLPENVKGRLATALGSVQAMTMAMHATPFSNSISVGTEATKHVWPALSDTSDAIRLMTLLVAGIRPRENHIKQRLADGYCGATCLADGLVQFAGYSFRDAHHIVGGLINELQKNGMTDLVEGLMKFHPDLAHLCDKIDLSPDAIVRNQRFGGGTAPDIQSLQLEMARFECNRMTDHISTLRKSWADAEADLRGCANDVRMRQAALTKLG